MLCVHTIDVPYIGNFNNIILQICLYLENFNCENIFATIICIN